MADVVIEVEPEAEEETEAAETTVDAAAAAVAVAESAVALSEQVTANAEMEAARTVASAEEDREQWRTNLISEMQRMHQEHRAEISSMLAAIPSLVQEAVQLSIPPVTVVAEEPEEVTIQAVEPETVVQESVEAEGPAAQTRRKPHRWI